MNPQYLPPQQFGPPQGNYPNARSSPSPGQFQNVPLGPPKPGYMPPPSLSSGQFPPPNSRPSPVPSSQLPPGGFQHGGQFGMPTTKGDAQNGPGSFQSDGQLPQSKPPSNQSSPPTLPITQSHSTGALPRPPSNQTVPGGPPPMVPTNEPSGMPLLSNTPTMQPPPTKLFNAPDGNSPSDSIPKNLPESSLAGPPTSSGPQSVPGSFPPSMPGHPTSMPGDFPFKNPSQSSRPAELPPSAQAGHPTPGMPPPSSAPGVPPTNQQSNIQGGPISNFQGGPQSNVPGVPSNFQSGPPGNMNFQGGPPSKPPSSNLQAGPGSAPSSNFGGPQSNFPGGPPTSFQGGAPNNMSRGPGVAPSGPPGNLHGGPTGHPQGGFPGGPPPPSNTFNAPPVGMPKAPVPGGPPPLGSQRVQQPGMQGPMSQPGPSPAQTQFPSFPPGPPRPGQPNMPPQNFNQHPGMPPPPNQPGSMPQQQPPYQQQQQPGMPPLPNQPGSMPQQQPPYQQQQPGMPPLPNQAGSMPQQQQPGMPPLPGQMGPNQLTGQMQGMNLGGPRQYPGMPMKNVMNGEGGPHIPPPPQQNYMNGQQTRGPQGGGYPPMPGQGGMPGMGQGGMPGMGQPGSMPGGPQGPGGYPQPNYQQPQQQRRLDPDQMPNPIQVTQDDQQNRSGVFVTNQKGLVPPLVTTNFVVQDQGNSSPRLIRSTMYNVPISQDIIKQTAVPFSLVISPMARHMDQEYPPPIVNFGELGPVRCIRCKAYMCPYMQFIDSGRRFQCLFCKATTDVPTEYFQHLDHTGQRMDRFERPELILGTYEFVATADYCRNNTLPKPPAVIFIIDVSYNNIKSGLVHLLCSQMNEIIQNLPVDQGQERSNMRVGFITYNSSVHFYNIKGTLAAPQMLVVGDTQEMFMPLLDGFLCTPEESGPVIDALMQQIPVMFGDTRETEIVLLPAIQAGLEALKASECAGKLVVFHSTLPIAEAPGKLRNREDRKLLGTDKEKTILTPQTQAYNQLGQDCVGAGCSVDLFIFNNSYIDIATIGQVARLTGGEVFKYTYFQADIDGDRLINDLIMDISRPIAFDAIMRVRTSQGIRPTDFYGHFFMSNTTDMELAAIDCDKAIAIEIKHDDKLAEEEGVYIQAALLYTSCAGQRRLRIINLSLKTCSQMADLYRSCELDTLINYLSKQGVYKLLDNNPKAVKEAIVNRAAQILATYRKNCASPSSAGQLILPECMKLLPVYVNCLLKSDALSGGSEMTLDDRSFVMQAVMTMDVASSVNHFYPRLISIHDIDISKDIVMPPPIRCSIEKMNEQGIYILENGIHMFLWFGLGVDPELIQNLFGAPSAIQVDVDKVSLPELDNPFSLAVKSLIEEIRIQRHRHMRLTIVRQREKLEPVFKHFLVEDRGTDGSPSYVDFLCHMHKEIRTLLS